MFDFFKTLLEGIDNLFALVAPSTLVVAGGATFILTRKIVRGALGRVVVILVETVWATAAFPFRAVGKGFTSLRNGLQQRRRERDLIAASRRRREETAKVNAVRAEQERFRKALHDVLGDD